MTFAEMLDALLLAGQNEAELKELHRALDALRDPRLNRNIARRELTLLGERIIQALRRFSDFTDREQRIRLALLECIQAWALEKSLFAELCSLGAAEQDPSVGVFFADIVSYTTEELLRRLRRDRNLIQEQALHVLEQTAKLGVWTEATDVLVEVVIFAMRIFPLGKKEPPSLAVQSGQILVASIELWNSRHAAQPDPEVQQAVTEFDRLLPLPPGDTARLRLFDE